MIGGAEVFTGHFRRPDRLVAIGDQGIQVHESRPAGLGGRADATAAGRTGPGATGAGRPGPDRWLSPEIDTAHRLVLDGTVRRAAESETGPLT